MQIPKEAETNGWQDPVQIGEDMEAILEYLWADEERNWEEMDRPKEHIFNCLARVLTHLRDGQ